ncbi:hypothetical protein NQ315_008065 [Exocentrus adspersus]|uniref:Lipid-binding serum glycoprotein N-terminal domain-containing protein n=1 Tax=Exocentrus adspersus TaxID=1586481 RepID=A0AAV8VXJ7_9CUCU|nr:hypothetical protein NQ315_008065 [Exocentrus adspersus]
MVHLRLLILVFIIALAIQTEKADGSLSLAPILEIGVRFVLLNLKRMGSITLLEDSTISIPESIKNISIGTIHLKSTQISGFETLTIVKIAAKDVDSTENTTKTNLCVSLLIDKIAFSTNYNADVGIIDEIPLYGLGDVKLAASDVDFSLCLNINIDEDFSDLSVDGLTLNLRLHDSPSSITGFWKSNEASDLVTAIINILEKFVCMWLDYEKDCFSCIISPVIQYVINSILPNNIDNKLDIKCSCLEEMFSKKSQIENLWNGLLQSYNEGTVISMINSVNKEHIKEGIQQIQSGVSKILYNEGVRLEL